MSKFLAKLTAKFRKRNLADTLRPDPDYRIRRREALRRISPERAARFDRNISEFAR